MTCEEPSDGIIESGEEGTDDSLECCDECGRGCGRHGRVRLAHICRCRILEDGR